MIEKMEIVCGKLGENREQFVSLLWEVVNKWQDEGLTVDIQYAPELDEGFFQLSALVIGRQS